ncbi:MAG: DUF2939 domain-containing protein [Gammaproteobacteria bacterium]|uniref:DUF2939 domain-containing protein n=1 Tax=Nevskia sp. TaxID=1929292 RepID=UPI003F712D69|nr:DUF2939 domain-containing protein [Gammaproteobacteria bacterium]
MKRAVATGAVVVLLIAAVATVALPLLALQGLRDALTARNGEALAQLVDADRLRGSLAARIRARYAQGPDQRVPIEPVVERLLTPSGLIAAICDGGALTVDGRVPTGCDLHGRLGDLRFESTHRYSAALSRNGAVAATVVMDRAGLHWRLVDLVLPPAAYDQFKDSVLN